MAERTFADIAFENKKRKTRRELFLERFCDLHVAPARVGEHELEHKDAGTAGRR